VYQDDSDLTLFEGDRVLSSALERQNKLLLILDHLLLILMEPKKDVSMDDASIVKDRHNKSSSSLLDSSNSQMTTEPSKRKPKKKRKKKVLGSVVNVGFKFHREFQAVWLVGTVVEIHPHAVGGRDVDASILMVIVKI
jgi:hypothetical protein